MSPLSHEEKDILARREAFVKACASIDQANVDLIIVTKESDPEKRSLTYHIENALNREYKYQKNLNENRQEKKEIKQNKENESFFDKYIAMTPPKTMAELLTVASRYQVKVSPDLAIFKSLLAAEIVNAVKAATPAVETKVETKPAEPVKKTA